MLERGDIADELCKLCVLVQVDGPLCLDVYTAHSVVCSEVRCVAQQSLEVYLRLYQIGALLSD